MQKSVSCSCMMKIMCYFLTDASMFRNYGCDPILRKGEEEIVSGKTINWWIPLMNSMFVFYIVLNTGLINELLF